MKPTRPVSAHKSQTHPLLPVLVSNSNVADTCYGNIQCLQFERLFGNISHYLTALDTTLASYCRGKTMGRVEDVLLTRVCRFRLHSLTLQCSASLIPGEQQVSTPNSSMRLRKITFDIIIGPTKCLANRKTHSLQSQGPAILFRRFSLFQPY